MNDYIFTAQDLWLLFYLGCASFVMLLTTTAVFNYNRPAQCLILSAFFGMFWPVVLIAGCYELFVSVESWDKGDSKNDERN